MDFPVSQRVKNLPVMQETQVQSLGQEDPLAKEMATHSNILAWRIPWTEEPSGLYSPWGCEESDSPEQLTHTKSYIRASPRSSAPSPGNEVHCPQPLQLLEEQGSVLGTMGAPRVDVELQCHSPFWIYILHTTIHPPFTHWPVSSLVLVTYSQEILPCWPSGSAPKSFYQSFRRCEGCRLPENTLKTAYENALAFIICRLFDGHSEILLIGGIKKITQMNLYTKQKQTQT